MNEQPSPEWADTFLDALRHVPVVSHACREAGIARSTAYKYRKQSTSFRQAWDDALEEGIDQLEERAWLAATRDNGDRALLMFLLKSLRPARYREGHPQPREPIEIVVKRVPERKLNAE